MGFGHDGFKTRKRQFAAGYGLIINFESELPRKYDEKIFGLGSEMGLPIKGQVLEVLGAVDALKTPPPGSFVEVLLRPNDSRSVIFDDLEKTREGWRFLLEGVMGELWALEARWAHAAGSNRQIDALEVVGTPHVSFENPVSADGPKSRRLYLNLNGAPTTFDILKGDGTYETQEIPFSNAVDRFKEVVNNNGKFSISQRILAPSRSLLVASQFELESALISFREAGYTGCIVRCFVPGVGDLSQVDVQVLGWPQDIPPSDSYAGQTFEIPHLRETKPYVELRDGEDVAVMEIIPGYVAQLIGNQDVERSTKHKFARDVIRGLSEKQMNMYGAQGYGPGISINAVTADGAVTGMTRLAVRTEGAQYRNLAMIPSPNFVNADRMASR